MRVYLDNHRDTPYGWIRVYWPVHAITLLKSGKVEELSLDHDLGDVERGTGYDVLLWIEQAVHDSGFCPPNITIHTNNSAARQKMFACLSNIMRLQDAC